MIKVSLCLFSKGRVQNHEQFLSEGEGGLDVNIVQRLCPGMQKGTGQQQHPHHIIKIRRRHATKQDMYGTIRKFRVAASHVKASFVFSRPWMVFHQHVQAHARGFYQGPLPHPWLDRQKLPLSSRLVLTRDSFCCSRCYLTCKIVSDNLL